MRLIDRIRRSRLVGFKVDVGDMRLSIQAVDDLTDQARAAAMRHWEQVESYFVRHSAFRTSLVPLPYDEDAPPVIQAMGEASNAAGVGPMACLPGAVCEAVAGDVAALSKEVVVSAEGATFVVGDRQRVFVVDAPQDEAGGGLALKVKGLDSYSLYSSLGRVRIQPVLGRARAVAVLAEHGAVADAVGSAVGAAILRPHHIGRALSIARETRGVMGAVVLVEGRIGVWGSIEIITPAGSK